MKRIAAVLIASVSLVSNAYALHPSDIIDNPSKFSDMWTRAAVQAFSCKNVDYDSKLKIVQFDDHFYEFPRFEGDPRKDDRISSLTRPTNTLILSEGWRPRQQASRVAASLEHRKTPLLIFLLAIIQLSQRIRSLIPPR